jgi:DNA (cytosine-5)-methyltransferase 1
MARIIGEVRPRFVFVENSPMLTRRGIDVVLGDLSQMGFNARWGIISAASVGANHKRERIWIVANSKHSEHTDKIKRIDGKEIGLSEKDGQEWSWCRMPIGASDMVTEWTTSRIHNEGKMANSNSIGGRWRYECKQSERNTSRESTGNSCENVNDEKSNFRNIGSASWWQSEPSVGRVADGVPARVDRLKAIGNAQVPLCAATAWRILNER